MSATLVRGGESGAGTMPAGPFSREPDFVFSREEKK